MRICRIDRCDCPSLRQRSDRCRAVIVASAHRSCIYEVVDPVSISYTQTDAAVRLFCSQQVRRDQTYAEQNAQEQEKHTNFFVHWSCFVKGGGHRNDFASTPAPRRGEYNLFNAATQRSKVQCPSGVQEFKCCHAAFKYRDATCIAAKAAAKVLLFFQFLAICSKFFLQNTL